MVPDILQHIPILQSDNFLLRELYATDSLSLFPTLCDEENSKFTLFEAHKTVEQTEEWIKWLIKNPCWAIIDSSHNVIGFVGYHSIDLANCCCRIGFHLNKAFWGKGIMPKAIKLTDQYLFLNSTILKIAATVKPENLQSQRCLLKSGYVLKEVIENYTSSVSNDHSSIRNYYEKSKF